MGWRGDERVGELKREKKVSFGAGGAAVVVVGGGVRVSRNMS